jgi:hypothetical protein
MCRVVACGAQERRPGFSRPPGVAMGIRRYDGRRYRRTPGRMPLLCGTRAGRVPPLGTGTGRVPRHVRAAVEGA